MRALHALTTLCLALFIASPVLAKPHKRPLPRPDATFCNPADIMRPCSPFDGFMGTLRAIDGPVTMRRDARRLHGGAWRAVAGISTAGVVAPLAAKVASIKAACGSVVVSGVRHTRIKGTRKMSLHSQGKAVDMQGNPACIYRELRGWAGGYSTDYGRARHVHISYDVQGGREMGLRFAHGVRKNHARHARHHRHRVVEAQPFGFDKDD